MILYLLKLYFIFFQVGLFSFGGGYVMLPLIYQQIEQHDLMPVEEFPDVVALSQMTPGPIAVNAATYTGYRGAGFLGALVATTGVVSPSLLLVFFVIKTLKRYKRIAVIESIFAGVRPVTVGMIAAVTIYFAEHSIFAGKLFSSEVREMGFGFFNLPEIVLFSAVLLALIIAKVNPIIITLSAGLIGLVFF